MNVYEFLTFWDSWRATSFGWSLMIVYTCKQDVFVLLRNLILPVKFRNKHSSVEVKDLTFDTFQDAIYPIVLIIQN